jgi:hypothetical protein
MSVSIIKRIMEKSSIVPGRAIVANGRNPIVTNNQMRKAITHPFILFPLLAGRNLTTMYIGTVKRTSRGVARLIMVNGLKLLSWCLS